MKRNASVILFALVLCAFNINAQNYAIVFGKISNERGMPLELVNVSIVGSTTGTVSDERGLYSLRIPANRSITLGFSHISYTQSTVVMQLATGERREYNMVLKVSSSEIDGPVITGRPSLRDPGITTIDPKVVVRIPSPTGGVEAVLKTIGTGVYSSNELSAQYNVRGGNYDENLVYVNDVEIYRPFLIRSGQQEGLSFINSALVSDISFSSGGFEARYGDKLSSVLDIQYKRPLSFAASAVVTMLGASAHVEGAGTDTRFSYLLGIRQKSNQYLLGAMETKGDYKPSFTDLQTYLSYQISDKWEMNFLGNISRNVYRFLPSNRDTRFGTINEALRLRIYFSGQEVDRYDTYTAALINTYRPNRDTELKIIASAFTTRETETFDIIGQYFLDQLEVDMGKDDFGDVAYNRGVGTFLNHARNRLDASVMNIEHKGSYKPDNEFLWGIKFQHEVINDKLSEWQMLDSAGYSIPHLVDSPGYTDPAAQVRGSLLMNDFIRSSSELVSNRISGYTQYRWKIIDDTVQLYLTGGIRFSYWDMNNQLFFSPRASLGYRPDWKYDMVFRLAAGVYHQPPFFREMRDFDGNINTSLKAQKSTHLVLGGDWNLLLWNRPFKMVAEVYYKFLDNLVPYEIDNVRIRYFAENSAVGYATGIDMKMNGEFVRGIESWASLSIMQTMEDIIGDFYYDYYNSAGERIIFGYTRDNIAIDSIRHEPGYIPRPTDQRVNFSLFFQDYLPRNPSYKMHLNLVYGSRLPFGPPVQERHKATLRIPPYRRVDIGFSKMLKDENSNLRPNNLFKYCKTAWISLEVFNLLQINNTISYLWITDVTNRMYAVPNYLTPRQLNIKLQLEF